jgi:hypothetical protein
MTEDIYDTLVFCFVKAARQYDPYYADKTRRVCEELYGVPKQFTVELLEARVGFDCTAILRSLVRKGYVRPAMNALPEPEIVAPGKGNPARKSASTPLTGRLILRLGTGLQRVLLRHQIRKHEHLRNSGQRISQTKYRLRTCIPERLQVGARAQFSRPQV